jgi:S-adenosylmethionine hydrolase
VSATFHGRDIFGPAAAYAAIGVGLEHFGPPVGSAHLLQPFEARPRGMEQLEGEVIHVDRYGNLVTTIRAAQLFPQFEVRLAGRAISRQVRTFSAAAPGTPFCHVDSSGFLAIALNQGNAALTLGVGRGESVTLVRR